MSIKSNTVWNLVGSTAPMLLGLATIPYLVRTLGIEAFGILTLIWALIGYFSIFDFGIGRALTQQVSAFRSGMPSDELSSVIRSGLVLVTLFGFIGGLALAALAYPFGHHWLNVTPSLTATTTSCLVIAAIGIPLTTFVTGLRGVLEGFEDFSSVNVLKILLGCATFGLPALSIWLLGASLEYVVVSLVAARLVILAAHVFAVSRHTVLWRRGAAFEPAKVKSLLSFGVWMTLSNIISPLMVTADRFIVSSLIGAAAVAYYTVPSDLILRLLVVPAALTGALFPRFADLCGRDPAAFRRMYRRGVQVVLLVMLPLCATIAIGSHAGLSLWLGPEFAGRAWPVASVLSIGLLFNGLAQIPHAALQASGGVRTTAMLHLCEFVMYVPVLYFCLVSFGLVGAAAAWTLRVFGDCAILFVMAGRRAR